MNEAIGSLRTSMGLLTVVVVWMLSYPSVARYMMRYEALRDFFAYRIAIEAVEDRRLGAVSVRIPWPPDPHLGSVSVHRESSIEGRHVSGNTVRLSRFTVSDAGAFQSSRYVVAELSERHFAFPKELDEHGGAWISANRAGIPSVRLEICVPASWGGIQGFFSAYPSELRLSSEEVQRVSRQIIERRQAPITVLGVPIDTGLYISVLARFFS